MRNVLPYPRVPKSPHGSMLEVPHAHRCLFVWDRVPLTSTRYREPRPHRKPAESLGTVLQNWKSRRVDLRITYPLVEELDRANLSDDILWKDLVEARGNLDFSVVRHIGDGVGCDCRRAADG